MQDGRPTVSVVMPFLGSVAEARSALAALATLRLRPRDELVVADNCATETVALAAEGIELPALEVVRAPGERSAFHARNVAAERAHGEWLLFVDADCRPEAELIDRFFDRPIAGDVGAAAGRIESAADRDSPMARWAASREVLSQERSMELPGGPAAATANLLVRRRAWADVGGFLEGNVSGSDHDFCWRIQDAGWKLELRPEATVAHLHRETIREVISQFAGYAAGDRWLNRRRPGAVPPRRAGRAFARGVAGAAWFAATLRLDRARMKAVDAIVAIAQAVGALKGNAAPKPPLREANVEKRLVIAADRFAPLTAQFIGRDVAALREAGWGVRVEAVERPSRPLLGGTRGVRVDYIEDEGPLDRLAALAALAARHPVRCARDLVGRRRFEPADRMPLRALAPAALRLGEAGERHVHVHFAALAAANALRVGRIVGVPVSITPHSQEVYLEPVSLAEKLERAAFVTTVCAYNVERLRPLVSPAARERIHNVPIGVRPEEFRRRAPYPGGRSVVAVGRLIEQKGFRHLIEAAAILEREAPLERLLIAGDGPLRAELEALAGELGIAGRVELLGSVEPETVRDLLERADVFAVPSVVAADGNRDAVPVVVYEAMASSVPVVASDEVGLSEVVRPSWGRLVPPADAGALAAAIAEVLAMSPAERAAMGEAGRDFVSTERDLRRQTARLVELIESAPPVV